MNTHNIKLPAEFRSGNDIPVTVATIKRERMEEILRDAVEAYRQTMDREDAELVEILREAAEIIAAVPTDYAPENLRGPIVDELEGFALMLDHAHRIEGDGA